MKSADLLSFTSMLLTMLWLTLQWRVTPDKAGRIRSAAVAVLIPSFFLVAGHAGFFAGFDSFPPRFALMPLLVLGLAAFLAFSRLGDNILKTVSLAGLVGFHSFRILAEAVIYLGVHEGIAPVQMSFEGYQFDIVTGVTALGLGIYLSKNPNPRLAYWFNWMGLAFLFIILFIAVTSMPLPFRLFMSEPDNTWVTRSPYIVLPGVLVTAAFTGHFLIFRKLKSQAETRT